MTTWLSVIGVLVAFCAVVYGLVVGFLVMVEHTINEIDRREQEANQAAAQADGDFLRRG